VKVIDNPFDSWAEMIGMETCKLKNGHAALKKLTCGTFGGDMLDFTF
jgi:hypothetical protein